MSARGPTGGPLDSLRQITKEIAEAQAPRRQDPKAEPRDLATLLLMPSGDPVLEYRQEQAPLVERALLLVLFRFVRENVLEVADRHGEARLIPLAEQIKALEARVGALERRGGPA